MASWGLRVPAASGAITSAYVPLAELVQLPAGEWGAGGSPERGNRPVSASSRPKRGAQPMPGLQPRRPGDSGACHGAHAWLLEATLMWLICGAPGPMVTLGLGSTRLWAPIVGHYPGIPRVGGSREVAAAVSGWGLSSFPACPW